MKQLEEKLAQTLIEKKKVMKENKKLEYKNKSLNDQIETISHRCTFLTDQLNLQKMTNKEQNKQILAFDGVEMSGQLTQFQNFQIYEKDKKILELNKELEKKNYEISKLKATISISNLACSGTEQKIQKIEFEIDKQKSRKDTLQNRVDELQQTLGAEAQFRSREPDIYITPWIYSSLKNQGVYQYNPNSVQLKIIKNIKYPIKPQNKTFDLCKNCNREFYQYRSCCNPLYNLDDKLLYVPGDAFNFAQAFKDKYLKTKNELEIDELLEILLFELNKIWHDREKNHLQLLAKHCKRRIQEIQRANSQQSLSEKEMLQNIKRLKLQVKDLQQENLEYFNQKFGKAPIHI
ncbi:unnamed protein product (macronuclear) [Paramecium tetraurelia]|uniref:Uncharacterized protein n=1 Tax=Paramecium tetraurelia TaxID=5888 RepID=A0DCP6_PARTE|nr:uncharacterized protein GSPATT00015692001 [Paramecium tetraurelia]CAK80813.1 unnamed protein product [Paramecium tetraurelia]|eukprot:XP_001448210.1 hypothetical protein (macronuclear) [Paramecium tetraurelia strain d4-2]